MVRGNVTPASLKTLIDNATQKARLMALAESANDTTASPDEPAAEHIVMETSENGSTIITDATGRIVGKVYRGQQLVIFGKYEKGGNARVTLKANLTGADKTYTTDFLFPDLDGDNPELERLWALATIENIEAMERIGTMPVSESENAIKDLGLTYQIVTDYTSMVVLSDTAIFR